jgi:hypothetical protein
MRINLPTTTNESARPVTGRAARCHNGIPAPLNEQSVLSLHWLIADINNEKDQALKCTLLEWKTRWKSKIWVYDDLTSNFQGDDPNESVGAL